MATLIDMELPVTEWLTNIPDDQVDAFIKSTRAQMADAATKLAIAEAIKAARTAAHPQIP